MSTKKGIFENTEGGTQKPSGDGPGRPTKHEGQTQNITVIFSDEVADDLRMKCIKMKKAKGGKFSMNEFIRPIIEAVLEADLDLSLADSEDELKELFRSQLEAGRNAIR
ncbi:MAG TPA: hypothetical protein VK112_14040 [Fodinibius sp.]|nr:hypothetical protein [Fodinibius sp.]